MVWRIYKFSGFSNTITGYITAPGTSTTDLDWSGGNLFSADFITNNAYQHSGFTTTILNTNSGLSGTGERRGVAFDGTNVISVHDNSSLNDVVVQYNGFANTALTQFNSPAPTITGNRQPTGCAWDGTDLFTMDFGTGKIYHHSGITSTILNSYPAPGAINSVGLSLYDSSTLLVGVKNPVNCVYRINKSTGAIIDSVNIHDGIGGAAYNTMYGVAWDGSDLYVAVDVTLSAPGANFDYTPNTGNSPFDITFTDTSTSGSSPITSWNWTFPGGTPGTASGQGPHVIAFNTPGTYTPELQVTSAEGSDTRVFLNGIVAFAVGPTSKFSISPAGAYQGGTVTFTDTSDSGTGAITSWNWTFTGGSPGTATGPGPHVVTYNTLGDFSVSLEITTTYGTDLLTKTDIISVLESAPSAANSVLAIDSSSNKVVAYSPAGTVIDSFSGPASGMRAVTYSNFSGNIITGSESVDRIYIHSGFSNTVIDSFTAPDGTITDFAFDTSNYDLISYGAQNSKIYVHQDTSAYIQDSFSPAVSSGATSTLGIAFDGSNLLTIDGAKTVFVYSGISSTVSTSFALPSSRYGIGVDNSGNLLSVDGSKVVYIHSGISPTVTSTFLASGNTVAPSDIAFGLIIQTIVTPIQFDGSISIVNAVTDLLDGFIHVVETIVTPIQFDGRVDIEGFQVGLFDGVINIYNVATDLFDSSIYVVDTAAELSDGLIHVVETITDLFDGSVYVLKTDTALFDGSIYVADTATDLFDGFVYVVETTEVQFDGQILVFKRASTLFDGFLHAFSTNPKYFDAHIHVVETDEIQFDGLFSVRLHKREVFDSSVLVFTDTTEAFDGWFRVNETTSVVADMRLSVVLTTVDNFDGNLHIYSVRTRTFDGALFLFSTTQTAFDARVDIALIAFFDARVFIEGIPETVEFFGRLRVREDDVYIDDFTYQALFRNDLFGVLPRRTIPRAN